MHGWGDETTNRFRTFVVVATHRVLQTSLLRTSATGKNIQLTFQTEKEHYKRAYISVQNVTIHRKEMEMFLLVLLRSECSYSATTR